MMAAFAMHMAVIEFFGRSGAYGLDLTAEVEVNAGHGVVKVEGDGGQILG